MNRIILGTGLVLGLLYLAVMPPRQSRTRETDAMEFALLILLMLLFTPLAFGYLFACLLFPFSVLVWRLLQRSSPALFTCGAGAVFLLSLSIPLQRSAQVYGNTFFATLLLFFGLALELWRARPRAAKTELAPSLDRGR
ncbi:MAG: hypothetical protein H0U88_03515 [Chthoniobacterales bacterium]|nr:hypothetical protein [Chthoniobacterales bacterium]